MLSFVQNISLRFGVPSPSNTPQNSNKIFHLYSHVLCTIYTLVCIVYIVLVHTFHQYLFNIIKKRIELFLLVCNNGAPSNKIYDDLK